MAERRLVSYILLLGILSNLWGPLVLASSQTPTRHYDIPFKAKWVTRLKKGKIFKYKRIENSSPKVRGDGLFVGTDSGRFYALNLKNGHKRWKFSSDGSIDSAAAFDEKALYFGDSKGVFYALDIESGELLWRHEKAGSEILSAPAVSEGRIYLTSLEGRLMALDSLSGSVLWQKDYPVPLGQKFSIRLHSTPVISGKNILVGFSDGALRAFNKVSGVLEWEKNLASPHARFLDVDMPVLVDKAGLIYAASFSGFLYCLNQQGAEIWKKDIGSGVHLLLEGTRLFMSGSNGVLYALDAKTGATLWERKLETGALTAPSLFHSTLVVGTSEKLIYFIHTASGDIMARRFTKKGISGDPVIHGNRLYYLSDGGLLYCLELRVID